MHVFMMMMWRSAIIVLLIGSVVGQRKKECPPPGSTKCTCEMRQGPFVTCKGLTDKDIAQALPVLKGYKLSRLTLANMVVNYADPGLFSSLHINHLVVERVIVNQNFQAENPHVSGLDKSLTVIEISNSIGTGAQLAHLQLDHLVKLKTIRMNKSILLGIGNEWFQTGPKKLETLILENNIIPYLEDRAFNALQGLKVLSIEGSGLGQVKRSMFPSPAPVLRKLDISHNNLKELPTDLFTDMPALTDVSINNNHIKSISSDTWPSDLRTQTNLYLDGNPFQCDNDLRWVCRVKANKKAAKCSTPVDKRGWSLSKFCNA